MSYHLLQVAMQNIEKKFKGEENVPEFVGDGYQKLIDAELDKFLNSEWAIGFNDRGMGHGDHAIIIKWTNYVVCEAMNGFAAHIVKLHNESLGFFPKPMTKFTCYYRPLAPRKENCDFCPEMTREWHPMGHSYCDKRNNPNPDEVFEVIPYSDGDSDLPVYDLWEIFVDLQNGVKREGYQYEPKTKMVYVESGSKS